MGKTIKNVVFILLLLTLSTSTAFLAYIHFFASEGQELSGAWRTELDMSERAAFTALSWLQEAEAVSVSLEEMEAYMDELTIEVNMTFEQTGHDGGTFRCNVVQESYDACRQRAYEGFAAAFRELLVKRLQMAGYTGGTDEEALEALVTETFGMSTVSYLMSCAPALLPSLEELQALYDGSGTYEAAEGILTRQFDAGGAVNAKAESYIRQDSNLILSGEVGTVPAEHSSDGYPVLYTLVQPQN